MIDDTATCPLADECANDDTHLEDLHVITLQVPGLGVLCMTLCADCVRELRVPTIGSLVEAARMVCEHCEHVGVTLDEMGEQLAAAQSHSELRPLGSHFVAAP